MNLSQYLRHADGCAVNEVACVNCGKPLHKHSFRNKCCLNGYGGFKELVFFKPLTEPTCTCQLDQLKERIVVLPEDWKEQVAEEMIYDDDITDRVNRIDELIKQWQ